MAKELTDGKLVSDQKRPLLAGTSRKRYAICQLNMPFLVLVPFERS